MAKKAGYDALFPTRLRLLMDRTGATQQAVADYVGVTRQAVANWKSGNTAPDMYHFQKLAEYFDVSYSFLYCDKTNKDKALDAFGFSDAAINQIIVFSELWTSTGNVNPHPIDVLNEFIESEFFDIFLENAGTYYSCKAEYMAESYERAEDSYAATELMFQKHDIGYYKYMSMKAIEEFIEKHSKEYARKYFRKYKNEIAKNENNPT
jgi:transcriptional regulator with XRE-family HTH domain